MSFYVTLPSNASMDIFPNNTQSNYTTILPETIILNNNYEVGLAEITYTQSVRVSLGFVEIKSENNENKTFKEPFKTKFEVLMDDCFSLQKLVVTIKNLLKKEIENYFNNNFRLNLNDDEKLREKMIDFNLTFSPEINYVNAPSPHFNIKLKPKTSFEFFGLIKELLKVNKVVSYELDRIFEFPILNDKDFHICDNYLVYTDIINEQFYGDVKSKIIRNVIPQGNHGQQVNIIYNTIHYVSLNKTEIKHINISLRDSQGQLIKFSDILGKVVVKLHFKIK